MKAQLNDAAGNPLSTLEHIETAAGQWGQMPLNYVGTHFPHPFQEAIYRHLYTEYNYHELEALRKLIFCHFQPAVSQEEPSQLAIWPSRAAFDVGPAKRVRGRPGKMIRKMMPWLKDTEVEELARLFQDRFVFDLKQYTLKTSTEAKDFKHAYSHSKAQEADPRTTWARKSLANSCMGKTFDWIGSTHPAEAYASGEFTMIWVEDKNGCIAARCVYWHEGKQALPAYGVNETVLNMVEDYIWEQGGKTFSPEGRTCALSFEGARLARLPADSRENGFYAPYLDCNPQELSDDGEYLVITSGGEIDASNYSGILSAKPRRCCDDCDGEYDEEDLYYIERVERYVCNCCRSDNYTYVADWHDYVPEDEAIRIHLRKGRYGWVTEYYSSDWADDNATEIDGDYYSNDLIYHDLDGEPFLSGDEAFIYLEDHCGFAHVYRVATLDGEYVLYDDIDPGVHRLVNPNNPDEWETIPEDDDPDGTPPSSLPITATVSLEVRIHEAA